MAIDTNISRRNFVAGTVTAGLASAACFSLGPAQAEDAPAPEWDAEFDVVVIGFGDGGATSALTAAENGAKVLVVEKAPVHLAGGNSRYAGQGCWGATDEAANYEYVHACLTENDLDMTEDVVDAFAAGILDNWSYLNDHLGLDMQDDGGSAGYKNLPGSSSYIKLQDSSGRRNARIYYALKDKIAELGDAVEIWFNTPGKRLVQDPATRAITGVIVEHDGQEYAVRAKNGVVMALGGYENNMAMLQNNTEIENMYPVGSLYNTGDGVAMCGQVGAKLWHMGGYSGAGVNYVHPEVKQAIGAYLQGTGVFGARSIFVGPDGTRFCDETVKTNHGDVEYHGNHRKLHIPNPCYAVFDQAVVDDKPVFKFWKKGNAEAIEGGWFKVANTIEELAQQMGISAEGLVAEVEKWNKFCENGVDEDFGRPADYLVPVATGPFYAMDVYPSLLNTLGGPQKNGKAEVIDWFGNPIPHLYAAGECGSVFNINYQGTGNVAECIVFGRIAGANAAQIKEDTIQDSLLGGKEPVSFVEIFPEPEFETGENEYIGVARGIGDELYVKVTLDGQTITAVEVLEQNETPYVAGNTLVSIPAKIAEAGTIEEINVKTGATTTATAIVNAVKDALAKAGIEA